jgi:hypothetical protein
VVGVAKSEMIELTAVTALHQSSSHPYENNDIQQKKEKLSMFWQKERFHATIEIMGFFCQVIFMRIQNVLTIARANARILCLNSSF